MVAGSNYKHYSIIIITVIIGLTKKLFKVILTSKLIRGSLVYKWLLTQSMNMTYGRRFSEVSTAQVSTYIQIHIASSLLRCTYDMVESYQTSLILVVKTTNIILR